MYVHQGGKKPRSEYCFDKDVRHTYGIGYGINHRDIM